MKITMVSLLVGAGLLMAACGSDATSYEETPSGGSSSAATTSAATTFAGQDAVPVRTETVQASTAAASRTFPGQVEGDRRVAVSTALMARIDRIAAQEGDRVAKGDVLIELDQSALIAEQARAEAMRQQAETALSAARNQLRRFTALHERGSATARELENVTTMHEQAQSALAAAESAVATVKQQLTHARIVSPVAGHVVARYADPGAMAQPGQPILEVETTSDLRVIALVPENHVTHLTEGDEVHVIIDAVESRFQGRLVSINQAASAPARQYRVEVELDHEQQSETVSEAASELKPGMYARLYVTVPSADNAERITIPEQALISRGQLTGVWVVSENNRARLRWIRPGTRSGGDMEVLSGLRTGERIVVNVDGRLADGQEVREQ